MTSTTSGAVAAVASLEDLSSFLVSAPLDPAGIVLECAMLEEVLARTRYDEGGK